MNPSSAAIALSYAACRRLGRKAGSSFSAGFLLLPREKRRAMHALYAFMRHTDDLADNPQPGQLRREALVQWRAALEHALLGSFDRPGDQPLVRDPQEQTGRALLPALADTVRQYRIPPEHLRAVIDGVEMDLGRRRYQTFDELRQYCERVASAVGLACIHIWGFRGPEALGPARQCGIALQLTNILRDIGDDAEQDRVYLPLDDLAQCGYSLDDLMRKVADERFERLTAFEIQRTECFYREGAALLEWLEPDGRRVFGLMMATYRALLEKIKRHPRDVFLRRVRLSRTKKLQLAARWALLPPRAAALF